MGIIVAVSLLSTLVVSNTSAVIGGITMTNISKSINPVHVGDTFKISAKISNHSNKDIHFGMCSLTVTINNAKVLPRICAFVLIILHPGDSRILSTPLLKAIHTGQTIAHLTFVPGQISKDLTFKIFPVTITKK